MLTISAIWTLCVLQFKAVISGNQTWILVNNTSENVLKRSLEKIEIGDIDEEESEESVFLYKFTVTILVSAIMLILEISLCTYLMFESYSTSSFYIAFTILYKDLILFGIFSTWNIKNKELSLFESLNIIPQWARTLERVSAFLSAGALLSLAWLRL
jgi:hypothetical protein